MNRNSSKSRSRQPGSRASARSAVRRARHEAYRGLILEAAARVFGEQGYADARMAEIALAAGVATGTVYAIFPSKRNLYRAVHRENLGELARRYEEIPDGATAGETVLARSRVATLFLASRPDYLRVYLREAERWGFDPDQLPADASAFVDLALYERGVAAGEFVDADPALLQSLLMANSQVHLAHWLRGGRREEPEALADRIQASARRFLFASP